jgi:CheY-like chemotaxis protein
MPGSPITREDLRRLGRSIPVTSAIYLAHDGVLETIFRSDELPVILGMKPDAFAEDIQSCIDAGMNAHVAKPINPNKLAYVLRDVLARACR